MADEDKTEQAWRNLFDELTDGQFTPIWQAIAELNGTAADPKAGIRPRLAGSPQLVEDLEDLPPARHLL